VTPARSGFDAIMIGDEPVLVGFQKMVDLAQAHQESVRKPPGPRSASAPG
jgi:hypothetical protein